MAKEIFMIKFLSVFNIFDYGKNRAEVTKVPVTYLLGQPTTDVTGESLIPQKITVKNDKIIVKFVELGIIHVLPYSADVELFYREKPKKNANQTEN